MENYLQVLEESLYKKLDVLGRIESLCARQEQILSSEPVSEEAFDDSIEEKGVLIDELTKLDEGFETLYGHIKEQLMAGREKYKPQINALQKKIAAWLFGRRKLGIKNWPGIILQKPKRI